MSTLTVRPLSHDDEDEWRRLWTLYLRYYESSVEELVYKTTFARLLSGNDNEFCGLIAELDGRAVGLTHYLFHRHCWRVGNVCYLQDLVVETEVRGQSIGRALIEAGRRVYDRVGELTPFIRYDRPG